MVLAIRRTGSKDYGQYVKALICGQPGSGKTLLGSTAPDPLIVDCEGGLMTIAHKKMPYAKIDSPLDLQHLRAALEQNPENQKEILGLTPGTIVIDTIDEVQRLFARERLKETGKEILTMQDYGWLKDRMLDVIRGFRNVDAHVIFLCHLKDQTDEELGTTHLKPGLVGATADEIAQYMDIVGIISVEEYLDTDGDEAVKRTRHILTVQPNHKADWLKDRSAKLPKKFALSGEDDFTKICRVIFKDVAEDTEPAEIKTVQTDDEVPEVIERSPEQPPNPLAEKQEQESEEAE